MVYLDPSHKLTQEFIALFDALPGEGKPKAGARRKANSAA
jgi:hypothetical protein